MKKKIKLIIFYLIAVALLSFFLINIKDYNNWWLSKIGFITGIKSKAGQWLVATLLDIIVKISVIITVVFIGKKLSEKGGNQ